MRTVPYTSRAVFLGSSGSDSFAAGPGYAFAVVGGATYGAVGFAAVEAVGGGGSGDVAYLHDSPGDDTFRGSGTSGTLTGPALTISVTDFASVIASGTAGGTNRKQVGAVSYNVAFPGDWT